MDINRIDILRLIQLLKIMNDCLETSFVWKELAAEGHYGKMIRNKFIRSDDAGALTGWRKKHNNQNVFVSVATFPNPCRQVLFVSPIYFVVFDNDLEQVRKSTLGVCFYLSDNFGIPQDCMDIIYDGDSQIILSVPPIVFDERATPIMPVISYHLSRQLTKAGVSHIDIDGYQRNRFFRLPNSINTKVSRYVIPLEFKEVLYLDSTRIRELSRKPRGEDSLIMRERFEKWPIGLQKYITNPKRNKKGKHNC